jgi:DNA-binding LytR/AlgR family response regulator
MVVESQPLYAAQLTAIIKELGYCCCGVTPDMAAATLLVAQNGWPDLVLAASNQVNSLVGWQRYVAYPAAFALSAGYSLYVCLPAIMGAAQLEPATASASQQVVHLAVIRLSGAIQRLAAPSDDASPSLTSTPMAESITNMLLPEALFIKEEGLLTRVNLLDIRWVYADGRQCQLSLPNRLLTVRQPFRKLAGLLPAAQFVQIQRSYIVNVVYIERLDTARNLVQVADQLLPIGLTYRDDLLRRLQIV